MEAKEYRKKTNSIALEAGIDVVLKRLSSLHTGFSESLWEDFVWGLEYSIGKEM